MQSLVFSALQFILSEDNRRKAVTQTIYDAAVAFRNYGLMSGKSDAAAIFLAYMTRSDQMASKTTRSSGKGSGKSSSSSAKKRTGSSGKKTSGNTKRTTSSTKKKSTTRKTTTAKRSKTSASTGSARQALEPIKDEIVLIVILFVSAVLLLSIFGLGGRLGDAISRFLFGMFGVMTYLVPFIFFIGVAFFISNRRNRTARFKLAMFVVFLFAVLTIIEVIIQNSTQVANLKDAYYLAATTHKGGGLIGGLVGLPLYRYCGRILSILIMLCVIAISGAMVTGKGVFVRLAMLLSRFADWAKVKWQEAADERAERRLEREQERAREEEMRRIEEAQEQQREKDEESYVVVHDETEKQEEKLPEEKKAAKEDKKAAKEVRKEGLDKDVPVEDQSAREEEKPRLPRFLQELEDEDEENDDESVSGKKPSDTGLGHIVVPEFLKGGKFTHNGNQFVLNDDIQEENKEPVTANEIEKALDMHFSEVMEQDEKKTEEQKTPVQTGTEQAYEENDIPQDDDFEDEADAESVKTRQRKAVPGKISMTPEEAAAAEKEISDEIAKKKVIKYEFPPLDLLDQGAGAGKSDRALLRETALKLQSTFDSFGVGVTVTDATRGPSVTRYEITPDTGVKVSRIVSLENDLMLNLAATAIRIEAPIPGKSAVGIEVPNEDKDMVQIREILSSEKAAAMKSKIGFAVGKDIAGQSIFGDIEKMPHVLIAGATGSGKSVCINTIVMSILYRADPSEVKMIMVDPKVVELSVYNGIPHLLVPVVTDPKKAAAALNWAVTHMMERYKEFSRLGVRNIKEFNKKLETINTALAENEKLEKMPQIIIIIDELADLMMVAQAEVENSIQRLAQLARAAGIHLVIATQRPSVNVITGTIKANIPSRIAFAVASSIDSRTILDMSGAEKLLGNGDMLFMPQGTNKPVRVQGAFVSDDEIARVTGFIKKQYEEQPVSYDDQITSDIEESVKSIGKTGAAGADVSDDVDVYFEEAGRLFIEKDKATIGMLQRSLRIGFNRASRLMDQLYESGVVGPETGTKARKIMMTMDEFEQMLKNR